MEKNMLWYNQCMGKQRRSRQFKSSSKVIDMEEARKQRQAKREAEKAKEEAKKKRSSSQNTRGKMAIRRSRNRRRLMVLLIALGIIAVIALSVINVISLKREEISVLKQQEELKEEKKELEKELSNINDPENLEEEARNQLRLIKPGEVLYMFPEEITEKNKTQESTEETEE
ncbi:MAG: septum formation initiator family protein [Bacillota bacterium]|nr:septum formation initiator family protein [Bacillota bacterium]